MWKDQVVEEWRKQLHQKIPELESPTRKGFHIIWYVAAEKAMEALLGGMPDQGADFQRLFNGLMAIGEGVKDKIGKATATISRRSRGIHPHIETEIQESWRPTFEKAKEMDGKNFLLQSRQMGFT